MEEGLEMLQTKAKKLTDTDMEEKEAQKEDEGVGEDDVDTAEEDEEHEEVEEDEEVEKEEVEEDEEVVSAGCPKCSKCKYGKSCKTKTQVVQCPGFGGSKWNIFVKSEAYVKSFGRFVAYVQPHKLTTVACGAWGSSGKNAYKFQLKGYLTTAMPNAVTGKTSYKDINMQKTDICKCSSKKKCVGGRASDIYLKVDLKNGRASCLRPSGADKKALQNAPKPSRSTRRGRGRPSPRPRPGPKVYKRKPKAAYSFKTNNCACKRRELKKFNPRAKKNTAAKCGAECSKNKKMQVVCSVDRWALQAF
jgi:hypothetical protein